MKFVGIYSPIITPYDDKGSINFDAIIEDLITIGRLKE
jgi:dihydrodipicolinate synthase/N-acetylneuraminate lyase|tara:strand:+ start:342 stop:455 length:114 start_codon:yes stop_codon:yes gene_type:complete